MGTLLLLAKYTKKGSDLSILHETAFTRIKLLFYASIIRTISGYLDNGVLNNWTKDPYNWDKEIVLITGGAGGIGGNVVKLLAERGIKVVVLDVIPMTFEACECIPGAMEMMLTMCSQECALLQVRHYLAVADRLCCGHHSV